MEILSKMGDLLSGGLGSKIVDAVKGYFPPSMSEAEKKEFELKLLEVTHRNEIELLQATQSAEAEFNARIRDMEGTASDLGKMPVLGPIMLFLRGCQRPMFGIYTLVMDFLVFSGSWDIPKDSRLESAFFAINLLVLGFLFGERAVRNVMPLLLAYFGKKEVPAK